MTDAIFERFSKYVKDEFGLTVIKKTSQERTSFKSLFEVSAEEASQYGLPYIVTVDAYGREDEEIE